MKSRGWLISVGLGALGVACSAGAGNDSPGQSASGESVYAITLSVTSASSLPKCTSALAGTIADVATPPGLWSCQAGHWFELPCTTLLAGAVAYSSSSHALWACVSSTWAAVPVPSGATGAQGPAGPTGATGLESLLRVTPEPNGAHCPTGGERIDTGLDKDSSGQLDPNEVQQTAYVCNAVPPPRCGDGTVDVGEQCDAAGESADCNLDCTLAVCGDGKVNGSAGEQCDVAGHQDTPTCVAATCKVSRCGDGHVNSPAGEQCDGGGVDSTNCDSDCTTPACGDGHLNVAREQCDDGNNVNGDGCSATCQLPSTGTSPTGVLVTLIIEPESDAESYSVQMDGQVLQMVSASGTIDLTLPAGHDAITVVANDASGHPFARLTQTVDVNDGAVIVLTGAWTFI